MAANPKARGWIFTINNWTEEDERAVLTLSEQENVKYLICGKEVGESGTPHLQGAVYFNNACRFSTMKKKLERAHLESARGDAFSNEDYCGKDGEILVEVGRPNNQGS